MHTCKSHAKVMLNANLFIRELNSYFILFQSGQLKKYVILCGASLGILPQIK